MNGHTTDGLIFVLTGASGSGRKTIAHQIAQDLGFASVISYTTRTPRPKEIDGRDYKFISRKAFIDAEREGEFFQTVEIQGNFYGTKKADIDDGLRKNGFNYVIVNRNAANHFKHEFGEKAVRLFIYASKQTIIERLMAHDTPQDIVNVYMNHYIDEVSYRSECEHVFENIDLTDTTDKVKKVMLSYISAAAN